MSNPSALSAQELVPEERFPSPATARWRMFAAGAWRPVVMLYRGDAIVFRPELATAAVLYIESDQPWFVVGVGPGDVWPADSPAPGAGALWEPV